MGLQRFVGLGISAALLAPGGMAYSPGLGGRINGYSASEDASAGYSPQPVSSRCGKRELPVMVKREGCKKLG